MLADLTMLMLGLHAGSTPSSGGHVGARPGVAVAVPVLVMRPGRHVGLGGGVGGGAGLVGAGSQRGDHVSPVQLTADSPPWGR